MTKPRVRENVLAGLAANLWQAALTIGLTPLYVRLMGAEAYGLVGVYGTLLVVLAVFELGLGVLFNRELAALSVRADPGAAMRALLARLEKFYWLVGIAIGALIWAGASTLRIYWLRPGELDAQSIDHAIALMGLAIALRWPGTLYGNGLAGVQRIVMLNVIAIAAAGGTALVTVLLLAGVSATPEAFFAAQGIGGAAASAVLAFVLRAVLPGVRGVRGQPAPQARLTRGMLRFAAGMTAISVVSVALSQVDKAVLSKLLSLEAFGHYSVAVSIASSLALVNAAIFGAHYPRFAQLIAMGDEATLARQYHAGAQAQAVLVFPLAATLIVFPGEVLALLGYREDVIAASVLPLQILVAATALNGAMHLPYALQFALGRTRLSFLLDLAAALVLVPLVIWLANRYGAAGAASGPLVQNLLYVTIGAQLMHRTGLPGEKWRWYRYDFLGPLAAAFTTVLVLRYASEQVFATASQMPKTTAIAAWLLAVPCAWLATRAAGTFQGRRS